MGWLAAVSALAAPALGGEAGLYTNQRYRFTLSAPPGYEVKAVSPQDLDLTRGGKKMWSLRVDDQLLWYMHRLKHPGQSMVVSRPGDDAWARLKEQARADATYFQRYARLQAVNWCAADGPDGSSTCKEIRGEKRFTTRHGFPGLEFHLIQTRQDATGKNFRKSPVGPVYAVSVPAPERPLVLIVTPPPGALAPADAVDAVKELINSLRLLPES